MDGLECSEILISDIEKKLFRIEAEYFKKIYKKAECILGKYESIEKYKKKIECGPFGSNLLDTKYTDNGILVVRPFNIVNCSIENERLVYITPETIRTNNLKEYTKGSLLFSRVGDIKVGYANRDNYTISPNIIVAGFENEKLSKYAAIFFNTFYGKIQIERQLKIAAQPTISTEIISHLKLPVFDKLFDLIIDVVNLSERYLKESNSLYLEAKSIIDKRFVINITNKKQYSEKSLSESLMLTNRLDAEYYQSKYDELFSVLKKFHCKTLGGKNGIVNIKKSIEPGSDAYQSDGIPFVRVSDISKFEISSPEIHLPNDIASCPSELYPKKDTILFSKDGSVGIAYKVEEDTNIITSGALLHLNIKDTAEVLPDYLTLVLNSAVVQLQAERDSNGAIIQHWKPSDVERVIIPILDMDIQKSIEAMVKKSFSLRHQANEMLGIAKQAVELAIEENEDVATSWMQRELSRLEV